MYETLGYGCLSLSVVDGPKRTGAGDASRFTGDVYG